MMQQDQAESLRMKMEDERNPDSIETAPLPPRSEYHKKNRHKKSEKKIKYPAIKILAFIFLLLPLIIVIFFLYQEIKYNENHDIDTNDNKYFDSVEFE